MLGRSLLKECFEHSRYYGSKSCDLAGPTQGSSVPLGTKRPKSPKRVSRDPKSQKECEQSPKLLFLLAHTCWDPNRATQCRAHSAAADSRNFRDVAGMSHYTPLEGGVAPVFPPPLSQLYLERSGETIDITLEGGVALHLLSEEMLSGPEWGRGPIGS